MIGPFDPTPLWAPFALYGLALWRLGVWLAHASRVVFIAVVWRGPKVLCVFLWTLVRRVHEDVRLTCAVDVPLGGLAAYAIAHMWFGEAFAGLAPVAQLGLCLSAGALTAAIVWTNMRIVAAWIATRRREA